MNYREKPSDFLTKRLNFSMQEVLYIHVGVGSQLIQFEMAADGGRFTLMTGDSITVERFAKRIQGESGYVFMNLLLLFSILLCSHFHVNSTHSVTVIFKYIGFTPLGTANMNPTVKSKYWIGHTVVVN